MTYCEEGGVERERKSRCCHFVQRARAETERLREEKMMMKGEGGGELEGESARRVRARAPRERVCEVGRGKDKTDRTAYTYVWQ